MAKWKPTMDLSPCSRLTWNPTSKGGGAWPLNLNKCSRSSALFFTISERGYKELPFLMSHAVPFHASSSSLSHKGSCIILHWKRSNNIYKDVKSNLFVGDPLFTRISCSRIPLKAFPKVSKQQDLYRLQRHFSVRSYSGNKEAAQISEPINQKQNAVLNHEQSPSDGNGAAAQETFPSGELEYKKSGGWSKFIMRLKLLTALPWQRVKKGSILKMRLTGRIAEKFQTRFSTGISLPQVCQNLVKAAYDPRISAVYLQIDPLDCGWGKIDEIRRHILFYKKTGKLIVCYMAVGGEKEYYLACACGEVYAPPGAYIALYGLKVQAAFFGGVLEKVGVEPQVQRIGKYKSLGDLLSRKDMSEANREMLNTLLDNIFDNWVEQICSSNGKTKKELESLLEEGVFDVEKLKADGWLTGIMYEDELEKLLKERVGLKENRQIIYADYRKYSRVKPWTLNLVEGKEQIAILRAVGNISRVRSGINSSGEGIFSDQFIEEIRRVRDAKNFKAVILRIDSPGGDALASDLLWRELRLLSSKKPVIASMVDVAASGGYYIAMAAEAIVAEKLTLTGSIGVVTGKFNLGPLYERVGFNKEIISRGRFSELDAEQRPFRPDEADFFAKSTQNAYKRFRDKAALSRSMEVEKMEEVAQGRVWTGIDAKQKGLVDAIGGFSKAVAIAKQKAGIPQEKQVKLVELSRQQPSIRDLLTTGVQAFSYLYDLSRTDAGVRLLNEIHHGRTLLDKLTGAQNQAMMEDIVVGGINNDFSTSMLVAEILKICSMCKRI